MQAGIIVSSPLCLAGLRLDRREDFPVTLLHSWGKTGVIGVSDPVSPC